MSEKTALRDRVRRRLGDIPPRTLNRASEKVCRRLLALPAFQQATCCALYLSTRREIQIECAIRALQAQSARLCAPAWSPEHTTYRWLEITPQSRFQCGPYDILEPRDGVAVPPGDIDLAIVPAVAFSPAGDRLGHGGGHFDRLLAPLRCPRIGLALEAQILPAIPVRDHDEAVDVVVTEETCYVAGERIEDPTLLSPESTHTQQPSPRSQGGAAARRTPS